MYLIKNKNTQVNLKLEYNSIYLLYNMEEIIVCWYFSI